MSKVEQIQYIYLVSVFETLNMNVIVSNKYLPAQSWP